MFYKVLIALDIIKINKHEFWICSFVEFTVQIIVIVRQMNFAIRWDWRFESLHRIIDSCQISLLLDFTQIFEARRFGCWRTTVAQILDWQWIFNEHNCHWILVGLRLCERYELVTCEGVESWKLSVTVKIDRSKVKQTIIVLAAKCWKYYRISELRETMEIGEIFAIAKGRMKLESKLNSLPSIITWLMFLRTISTSRIT